MAHDWPNLAYGLNRGSVGPGADCGTSGGYLSLLRPGAHVAGLYLQDVSLFWPVSPSSRRSPDAPRPVECRFGVYLFLSFGLGLFPGWNDRREKDVLLTSAAVPPPLRFICFAGEIKRVAPRGAGDQSHVRMVRLKRIYPSAGVRFDAEETLRRGPRHFG